MTEKPEYIRIRVGLVLDPSRDILFRNEKGSPAFTPEFVTKLHEEDAKFREPIITFINDAVGTHNWAIQFSEFYDGKTFDVRVYCPNQDDYWTIRNIVLERIRNIPFNFYYMGVIENYIEPQ